MTDSPRHIEQDFNPRSPHGERQGIPRITRIPALISIHAPRTGSDENRMRECGQAPDFNPRSPHGERPDTQSDKRRGKNFNPRSPHGERRKLVKRGCFRFDFNPRSPHGERRQPSVRPSARPADFNPRSPHGERLHNAIYRRSGANFNPRSPHGERRSGRGDAERKANFNPRSPHGERRDWQDDHQGKQSHFNPRSPHGERLRKVTILSIRIIDFAQKVYHKTVLLRISLAENAVILPKRPQNPVRTSLQKAGGLRFARAIRAAIPYSISSPSGA